MMVMNLLELIGELKIKAEKSRPLLVIFGLTPKTSYLVNFQQLGLF